MAAEKKTCPTCGSAVDADAIQCDICGEDLSSRAAVEESSSPAVAEAAPEERAEEKPDIAQRPSAEESAPAKQSSATGGPGAGRAGKKTGGSGAKRGQQQKGRSTDPLFSTPQWIAISVSAFILGAVLTAAFLPAGTPSSAGNASAPPQNNSATQQPQMNLQQLENMRAAVESNPDDIETRLNYANALHDAGLIDQAIVQYKDYLEKNPGNPDARVDLGICYFELKQYDDAIREMERAVKDAPTHQLGHFNLGIVNLNAGNLDKAREWFEKARDLDPTSAYGRDAEKILEQHFSVQN